MTWRALLFFCVGLIAATAVADEPPQFELKDGDRVVFLGNTLIEREQKYGYWELMLTMAWPERNVTFRNLGWSGDTVWGESRAGFGTQADGFKALVEQVHAAKPTVIFVGYGNVEAFEGEQGLPKFIDGFNKLLDELEKSKARIVVLSPYRRVERESPNGSVIRYNAEIDRYSARMKSVVLSRGAAFVDLNGLGLSTIDSLTINGVDLTASAYALLGRVILIELATPYPRFDHCDGPFEALRQAIVSKNELFFHRWRPQNETYLFGFRKHEQGKNAKEVFDFDPLIAAEEKKIAELRVKLAAEMKKAGAK